MLKRVILFTALLLLLSFSLNAFAMTNDYANHWAKSTIEKWFDKGIINGYGDGSFKPDNAITRAEFAQVLVRIFKYTDTTSSINYSDVTYNDWFYDAVNLISNQKLMYDFNEKQFKANDIITKEEAIYALAKAYNVVGTTDKRFNDDNEISQWAKESLNAMYLNNYIKGNPSGDFMPKNNLTRAELLTIIDTMSESISSDTIKDKYCISGTIVDDKGDPAKGAKLYVSSGEINLYLTADDNGKFALYTESNRPYYMQITYFDKDDYGYKSSQNLPKLISNHKDIVIKLEKTPVVVYNAVDKNDLDISYVRVYKTNANGNTYQYALAHKTIENTANKTFETDYTNNSYRILNSSSSEEKETILTNVKEIVTKIDEYKTEIKLIIGDYGLDSTTFTGKIICNDNIPTDNVLIKLYKYDKDEKYIEEFYTYTDKNGNYAFNNLDSNFQYKVYSDIITYNDIYYTSNMPDIRIDKNITFHKAYNIKLNATGKNGNELKKDVILEIHNEMNSYLPFHMSNYRNRIFTLPQPGTYTISAKIEENGKIYSVSKQITIVDGQYKSYDCTFVFDDF